MEERPSPALIQDLFRLIKRFQHIRTKREASRYHLTRSEYELLAFLQFNLSAEKTALPISEISALLQITPAAVTHMVNPLEEKGFLERRADPNDRRVVLVAPTQKGEQTAEAFLVSIQDQLFGVMNHLGEQDSREFLRLMRCAIEYLSDQIDRPNHD